MEAELERAVTEGGGGHALWVRACHWLLAATFFTLAYTGFVILMSHPRLYWGDVGNDLTPPLLELPISRNHRHGGWEQTVEFAELPQAPISASRTYEIFNENGWGRSLHFLAAWVLVATGAAYFAAGALTGHLRRDLLPRRRELSARALARDLVARLRPRTALPHAGPPYGGLQKTAYCAVAFVALPLMAVTGLAMAPAITAEYPILSAVFGGSQSARTIHFFVFAGLCVFTLGHVLLVAVSGAGRRMRAMTWGK